MEVRGNNRLIHFFHRPVLFNRSPKGLRWHHSTGGAIRSFCWVHRLNDGGLFIDTDESFWYSRVPICLIISGSYAVMPLKSRGLYNLIQSLDSDQEGNISVFWGNPKLDSVDYFYTLQFNDYTGMGRYRPISILDIVYSTGSFNWRSVGDIGRCSGPHARYTDRASEYITLAERSG